MYLTTYGGKKPIRVESIAVISRMTSGRADSVRQELLTW